MIGYPPSGTGFDPHDRSGPKNADRQRRMAKAVPEPDQFRGQQHALTVGRKTSLAPKVHARSTTAGSRPQRRRMW